MAASTSGSSGVVVVWSRKIVVLARALADVVDIVALPLLPADEDVAMASRPGGHVLARPGIVHQQPEHLPWPQASQLAGQVEEGERTGQPPDVGRVRDRW